MAGIGFELRKLTAKGHFTGWVQASAGAAIISAGPWMISIFSLMLLAWLLHRVMPADDVRLFTASITHVYAFSLILAGPVQLVLTRYTSDCLSQQRRQSIFPSFVGAALFMSLAAAALGGTFFIGLVPAPPWFQVAATALMVHVVCLFIASTYLSALRRYNEIVVAFFVGYGSGCAAAWWLAQSYGVAGAMVGFLAGHFLLFIWLATAVYREFGSGSGSWFSFTGAFRRFPGLMFCGLFYNLGIWVDKFLFWWFSQSNIRISGELYAAPDYDLAIYLSLLSIVPGMAVFFLKVETDFAESFEAFYSAVREGRPLSAIMEAKQNIIRSLHAGFMHLLKVQGITTAILVIFADRMADWFHIGFVQTGIFRITLFGAMLLIVFLCVLTVLFYFDDRKGALICSLVFLIANASLSYLTLTQNEAWYGFGFVAAAGCALYIAALRINRRMDQLEYHTFAEAS